MDKIFNAQEVFDIAIRIEENGTAYYKRAASLQHDEDKKKFLAGLAGMEDEHRSKFMKMKTDYLASSQQENPYDPTGEALLYLQAVGTYHGGEGTPSITDSLTEKTTMAQILGTAVDLEKKSILYYVGLKQIVPQNLGRDVVDAIIAEEQSHVVQLTKALQNLQ